MRVAKESQISDIERSKIEADTLCSWGSEDKEKKGEKKDNFLSHWKGIKELEMGFQELKGLN